MSAARAALQKWNGVLQICGAAFTAIGATITRQLATIPGNMVLTPDGVGRKDGIEFHV